MKGKHGSHDGSNPVKGDWRLQELKKNEKNLFDTYNRRAPYPVKINHLSHMINVMRQIVEIEGK